MYGMGNGFHTRSASFIKSMPARARLIVTPKYFRPFFFIEKRDKTTATIEVVSPITDIAPGTMLTTKENNTSTIAIHPAATLIVAFLTSSWTGNAV